MKIGIFRKNYHLNIGRKDTKVRRKIQMLGGRIKFLK